MVIASGYVGIRGRWIWYSVPNFVPSTARCVIHSYYRNYYKFFEFLRFRGIFPSFRKGQKHFKSRSFVRRLLIVGELIASEIFTMRFQVILVWFSHSWRRERRSILINCNYRAVLWLFCYVFWNWTICETCRFSVHVFNTNCGFLAHYKYSKWLV